MSITLATLAKELNLSIGTVSKALHDSHEISIQTKATVLAKAKELNYQVNPFASGLRKQKSKTIAVVIPEIDDNFFTLAINGIESIAQQKSYHVLIYLTHEDVKKEATITGLLQNGRVDGIMISISSETADSKHLEELRRNEIPLVFFDRVIENISSPKIVTDDFESGFKATEHLLENGCKRIAFLSISNTLSINNNRLKGYEIALKNQGIKLDPRLIIPCSNNEEKNSSLIRKILKKKNRPDGIIASVEKLAIPSYEICNELEIKIPEDVKIISFSNLKTASLLNPSMTTITQPAFKIGEEAASILFKLIEKKGVHFIHEKTILKSILIPRNSTQKV